jgi:anti-sigma factor RsiW
MRSTHPFEQEEVMAYLDGEIAADRASEIAQHMQKCAECQALAATFRNLSRELSAWEIEGSPIRLTEKMNAEVATAAAQPNRMALASLGLTPVERLTKFLSPLNQRPWAWAGVGVLATVMVMVISLPALRSWPAPKLAAREAKLRAVQRIEQQEVASSRENNPSGNRYSVSVAPGNAAPASPPPHREIQSLVTLPNPGVAADKNGLYHGLGDHAKNSFSADGRPINDQQGKVFDQLNLSPMIARTASLSLVVKNFTGIEAAVKAVVSRHSGYIGELNTATPPDAAKTFSATLRVPSAQLEPALTELKQLGRADQESQSGEEVTKQYVDLAARLKNSRATEQRLLDVLRNNTGKVKDVLEVENEIARVRGEIEEMEADQRALQSRIDFATITLSVTEEYKASLNAAPSSMGTRLHNAFVTGYHGVVENVIGLLAWLLESGPTLLFWAAVLFFPVRWAWRRMRQAFDRTQKPVAA